MRLQKLLQLHYRLLADRMLLPLLLALLPLFLPLLLPLALIATDGDGLLPQNLLVLFAVFDVFGEVLV